MMLSYYIRILYLSAQYLVIYANPLYQTYGSQCQWQHSPWYPSDLIFEPTNINPYAIVPQPSLPIYQTPADDKEYINEILSDPVISSIIDPKTKLFDRNGIEIPRISPEGCTNIINNYIIIPQDVLAQKKYSKQSDEGKNNSHERKLKTSHRSTRKHNKFVENNNDKIKSERNFSDNSNGKSNDNDVKHNLIPSENKNGNIIERKPKVKVRNKNSNKKPDKALDKNSVTVKEKEKVIRLKIITHPINPKENAVVQEFRRKFPGIPEEVVRSLLAYLKSKISRGEISINDQISYIPTNNKQSATKNNRNSRKRKGRKRKHPKKEEPMKDKKCESTLETSTCSLDNIEEIIAINNDTENKTKYLEQVEINPSGAKFLISEDTQKILEGNEAIVDTKTMNSTFDENFKSINFDLTPQNVNENLQEKVTEKSGQTSEDDEEIVQKINQQETKKKIDQNYKPDSEGYILDYNYNVDNTRLPELGTEDEVPITLNGLFEEYYPDFRAENQFALSRKEVSSPGSHIKIEELSRERRKYEQNYNKNHYTRLINEEKVYETDKNNEKYSDALDVSIPESITLQSGSEETKFIVPPALETPDFETKNIRELKSYNEEAFKYEPNYKFFDVSDKTSVYSDTKNSKFNKARPIWKKEKHGDLETMYAQSKVAKYGHNSEDENILIIAESYPDYEW